MSMKALGWGEKTKGSHKPAFARSHFLKVLAAEAPECVEQHQTEVMEYYLSLPPEDRIQIHHYWKTRDRLVDDLREALTRWASGHNLNADWVLESALEALLWFSTPADMYDPDYWEGGDWTD